MCTSKFAIPRGHTMTMIIKRKGLITPLNLIFPSYRSLLSICLLKDCSRNEHALCLRIVSAIKELPSDYTDSPYDLLLNHIYFDQRPIGFFDGAAARGECGVGIVLRLNGSHYYRLFLVISPRSNIKDELFGLWGSLSFASYLHISDIMVVRDSNIILDWFESISRLQGLSLLTWKQEILELKHQFSWIQSFHVHRQFNTLEDYLSKDVWCRAPHCLTTID